MGRDSLRRCFVKKGKTRGRNGVRGKSRRFGCATSRDYLEYGAVHDTTLEVASSYCLSQDVRVGVLSCSCVSAIEY